MEHDDSTHHPGSGSPDTPEMAPPNPITGIPPPDNTTVLPSENTTVGERGGRRGGIPQRKKNLRLITRRLVILITPPEFCPLGMNPQT